MEFRFELEIEVPRGSLRNESVNRAIGRPAR